jgi:hypothetical protein
MANAKERWKVTITEQGRAGTVHYAEGWFRRLAFGWEFGGGDAVAMIRIPSRGEWQRMPRWAVDRRDEIVRRVAHDVRRQRCPTCSVRLTELWIELVEPAR